MRLKTVQVMFRLLVRKVTVVDSTAPEITANGKLEIAIEANVPYDDAGAEAYDT